MTALPRPRLLRSVGVSIGVFVLFGAVTGLLPNPVYVRMVSRTPADYLFLVATAAFAGAFVYQRSLAEKPIGDRFAAGGIIGGFLAFGCPICNAVLLALFSSSALDVLRPDPPNPRCRERCVLRRALGLPAPALRGVLTVRPTVVTTQTHLGQSGEQGTNR